MIDKVPAESTDSSSTANADRTFPHVQTDSFGQHEHLQIYLDNETVAKLREPNQHAHVRDEDGNIVGVFKAMSTEDAEFYQYALETVDFDELDRRIKDPRPGRTTKEILDELRNRDEEECVSR